MNTFHINADDSNTTLLVAAVREALDLAKKGTQYAAIQGQENSIYTVAEAPVDFQTKDYQWFYTHLGDWLTTAVREVRLRTGIIFNYNNIEWMNVWTPGGEIKVLADRFKGLAIKDNAHMVEHGVMPFSVVILHKPNGYQLGSWVGDFNSVEEAKEFIKSCDW